MSSESNMNFENLLDFINFVLEEKNNQARKWNLEAQTTMQLPNGIPIPKNWLDSLLENPYISGPIFYLSETKAKSVIRKRDLKSDPEMIEYERNEKNFWRITSLKEPCYDCAETGILNDIEVCSTCFGESWKHF
jgi:hypothetical protein